MNRYKFDSDLELLETIPTIKEIQHVAAYLPQTVVVRSTTLCVDINISPIILSIKDSQGNYSQVNKGLCRYHTIYVPDQDIWLPILLSKPRFWRKAASNNKDLTELLKKKND